MGVVGYGEDTGGWFQNADGILTRISHTDSGNQYGLLTSGRVSASEFCVNVGGDPTTDDCSALGGGGGYWAANGIDIYNTNTGYVGIGTVNPVADLTIDKVLTMDEQRAELGFAPLQTEQNITEDATN